MGYFVSWIVYVSWPIVIVQNHISCDVRFRSQTEVVATGAYMVVCTFHLKDAKMFKLHIVTPPSLNSFSQYPVYTIIST